MEFWSQAHKTYQINNKIFANRVFVTSCSLWQMTGSVEMIDSYSVARPALEYFDGPRELTAQQLFIHRLGENHFSCYFWGFCEIWSIHHNFEWDFFLFTLSPNKPRHTEYLGKRHAFSEIFENAVENDTCLQIFRLNTNTSCNYCSDARGERVSSNSTYTPSSRIASNSPH